MGKQSEHETAAAAHANAAQAARDSDATNPDVGDPELGDGAMYMAPALSRAIRLATWAQQLSARVLARYPNDSVAHAVQVAADAPSSGSGRHEGVAARASDAAAAAHRAAGKAAVTLVTRGRAWGDV